MFPGTKAFQRMPPEPSRTNAPDALKEQPRRDETVWLIVVMVLAILIRLVGISEPYVDAWSYKQGTIAMIAENFYRNGFNIFYPQINWAGSAPGYMGTEFPLIPFVAALLYIPFGVHDWIGRSASLFFFVPSMPFFYFLVKTVFNKRTAQFALAIYALVPLSIFASRSFISDMTSLSFSIMALYFFMKWLQRPESLRLLLTASLITTLAILVKAPAIMIGLPALYMAWEEHGWQLFRRPNLWIFAFVSLIFPLAWYIHAYLTTLWYPPYKFAGSEGLALADLSLYGTILRQVFTESLTPIVCSGMLIGLFLPSREKRGRMFHWWLLALSLFVVVAGFGNRHPWYQLPIVPIAAALTGRAMDVGLRRLEEIVPSELAQYAATVVFFASLTLVCYIYAKPLYEPIEASLRNAGREVDRITPPDALVIFVVDGDSSAIYYSRRKGWHAFHENNWGEPLDSGHAIMDLEKLRNRGARYIVFTQYTAWWLDYYKEFRKYLDSRYSRVRDTDDYVIFDLQSATG
jgi:4-amino-4-deoxy-L-arabinose transferase-like glycosyltransferase